MILLPSYPFYACFWKWHNGIVNHNTSTEYPFSLLQCKNHDDMSCGKLSLLRGSALGMALPGPTIEPRLNPCAYVGRAFHLYHYSPRELVAQLLHRKGEGDFSKHASVDLEILHILSHLIGVILAIPNSCIARIFTGYICQHTKHLKESRSYK